MKKFVPCLQKWVPVTELLPDTSITPSLGDVNSSLSEVVVATATTLRPKQAVKRDAAVRQLWVHVIIG